MLQFSQMPLLKYANAHRPLIYFDFNGHNYVTVRPSIPDVSKYPLLFMVGVIHYIGVAPMNLIIAEPLLIFP